MGGALSPPPSGTEKDWRARSWEGRIDCVGGGGGGTDPRFGEEGLLWFYLQKHRRPDFSVSVSQSAKVCVNSRNTNSLH